ncbi:MAG: hypothetical protein CMI16_03060 [Opitutaceae bacterium]|nr:hypothetical protein [Opitutaceae bacterium]
MSAYLELTVSKAEAPLEDATLTRGTTLGAACARYHTLLSTTGANFHTRVFLTERPQTIKLPLPSAVWRGSHFEISDRAQMLASVTRLGASINATLCSTVSGQVAYPIQLLLTDNAPTGIIPLTYPNWDEISSAIGVRQVRVVDENSRPHVVKFTDDTKQNAVGKAVEQIMLDIYNSAWERRQILVSPFAPSLTKSVMRVPYGHNATGYSLCAEVVGKKPSLSNAAMEGVLKAAIEIEFGDSTENYKEFLDNGHRGMKAAKYAENVVSALSTLTAALIPYRADGRTVFLPSQLQTFPAESWSAEATAAPISADDCDGSAANITSFVHQVRRIFEPGSPPENQSSYPYLYALHRTLAHYEVGIAILGANAANADAADQGKTHLAGHAMALFIPRLHLVHALDRGARSRADTLQTKQQAEGLADPNETGAVQVAMSHPADDIAKITEAHIMALYGTDDAIPHDELELKIIRSGAESISEHGHLFATLQPLAGEGTSAAQSRLYTKDGVARAKRARDSKHSMQIAELLSPSVASVVKALDAGEDDQHMFYRQFVELIFDTSSPLMKSTALLHREKAHCQVVLVSTTTDGKVIQAGVTPKQLATGDFAAIPLYTVDEAQNTTLQKSLAEVQQNTLGRSSVPLKLGKEETQILASAKEIVEGLNRRFSVNTPSENAIALDVVIPFAALAHNRRAVKGVSDLILMALPPNTAGVATWTPIDELATGSDGSNAGAFVSLQLSVDPQQCGVLA